MNPTTNAAFQKIIERCVWSKERSLRRSCAFLLLSSAVVGAVVVVVGALLLVLVRYAHTHIRSRSCKQTTHIQRSNNAYTTHMCKCTNPSAVCTPTHTVGALTMCSLKITIHVSAVLHTHMNVSFNPKNQGLVYKGLEVDLMSKDDKR